MKRINFCSLLIHINIHTYILHLTRFLCHVRNTRKDNYSIYARNMPSLRSKKITDVCLMFVACFHAHCTRHCSFLSFFLSYSQSSYMATHVRNIICTQRTRHTFSLSITHSVSCALFYTFVPPRSILAKQIHNIQFGATYSRKYGFHRLAQYVLSTYIIPIYMYI